MGNDREGTIVKEMTAREILDAIRSGLEETSRRFAKKPFAKSQPDQARSQIVEEEGITAGHENSEAPREKAKL
jgi:hypothetical protein